MLMMTMLLRVAAAEGCSIAPQVVNAAVLAMATVIAVAGAAGSINRLAGSF